MFFNGWCLTSHVSADVRSGVLKCGIGAPSTREAVSNLAFCELDFLQVFFCILWPAFSAQLVSDKLFFHLECCSYELRGACGLVQQWFPKCPPRIRDRFPKDPWIHFCNCCFEMYVLFLMKGILFCSYSRHLINSRYIYFIWLLEYIIKKPPVHTEPETLSLRSDHAVHCYACYWCVIFVAVWNQLWYKFLIFDT